MEARGTEKEVAGYAEKKLGEVQGKIEKHERHEGHEEHKEHIEEHKRH
jgi:hypothetical protein